MIRKLKQADSVQIEKFLNKIPLFTEKEVKVAMELVNIAASNPTQTDYNIYVYSVNEKVLGYHCIGKRPLTDAVYDLYWIVADPESEIKGIGASLIKHAEDFMAGENGRWILAETSSKESYTGTRNFYLRNNFTIISQINDFYKLGDHLIVFGKYFSNKSED